ncbi:MAG: hypothetical protein R3B47_19955 [Bacteroidia bacterium]
MQPTELPDTTHGDGLFVLPLWQFENMRYLPGKSVNSITQKKDGTRNWLSSLDGVFQVLANDKKIKFIEGESGFSPCFGFGLYPFSLRR